MEPFYLLQNETTDFPAPSSLGSYDFSVIGSNLEPDTLIGAYKKGYFPWFNEGEPIMWYHPLQRLVIFPDKLHISKSMRTTLNQNKYRFTIDRAFPEVMELCKNTARKGQPGGSWIHGRTETSYGQLFERGIAHSAEAWKDGELVGGLYGVQLGQVFFGESMFANQPNASKFAFINFVRNFQKKGGMLIDCQMETPHLRSLGGVLISRKEFVSYLEKYIPQNDNVW